MIGNSLKGIAGAAALAALAVTAQPASAAVIFYNNAAAFAAASGALSLEGFADNTLNADLTITGSHVSISGGRLNDQINDNGATSTTFAFAQAINAFGGDFDLAGPGGQGVGIRVTVNLLLDGLTLLSQEIPRSLAGGFWGFVSTQTFNEVRFSEGTQDFGVETYRLDNLRYAVAIPAPAALGLFGLGLLALGAVRRRAA